MNSVSRESSNPLFEIRKIHHPVSSVVHPSSREEKRVKCYIKSRTEKINKCVISFCQAAPGERRVTITESVLMTDGNKFPTGVWGPLLCVYEHNSGSKLVIYAIQSLIRLFPWRRDNDSQWLLSSSCPAPVLLSCSCRLGEWIAVNVLWCGRCTRVWPILGSEV